MVDEFEEVDLLYRFPDDEDDDDHFSELSDSDSEDDTDNMYLDKSDLDLREEKVVARLYGSKIPPCCSNQCNEVIPKKMAVDFRTSFMNLDKESQDLIILAHLAAHRDDAMLRSKVGDRSRAMKKRYNQLYYFRSLPICRDMYFFLYTMGIKRYKNLIEHYDKNGVYPREHGMTNKINRTDALTTLEKKEIVSFICRFAETVAITLPGRQPNHRDYRLLKLPTTESKTSVYTRYTNSVEPGGKIVKLRTFQTLWKKYCPYIVTMKPAYDLCELCRNLAKDAVNTVNVTEVEKEAALKVYSDHLQSASTQREYYNDLRTLVKPDPNAMYPGIPEEDYLVISMDYAQNVSFPSGPQQIGTAYFKSGRKTAIFGITNERQNVQHIFCIDESDSIGKGPNSVISMLDYYLREVHSTKKLVIFADNCVSQNKNNAMIRYLQHLVDTSRCESVELNFLLSGHTKFSPDRLFGVFKSKYAQTTVDCFMDVVDCVRKSSRNGFNVPVPIRLPNSSEPVVEWRKWDEYFSTKYKTLIGISKYHHFVFIAQSPVQCKLFANSASINENIHLSNNTSFDDKPIIIPSPGLSMKRQWYLYKEIRGLCFDDSKKDSVAPLPLVSGNGNEEEDSVEVDNPQEVEAADVKKKSKKNKGPVPSSSKEPIRKNRRLK